MGHGNESVTVSVKVEVSDFAKALLALETERTQLDAESARVNVLQTEMWDHMTRVMAQLSQEQLAIMKKRVALEEAIFKLLRENMNVG